LYSRAAPPGPHSFPTRRSSDLARDGALVARAGIVLLPPVLPEARLVLRPRFVQAGDAAPREGGHPETPRGAVLLGAGHRHENPRSEEHTSELQSRENLVCRLLL